jgi:Transposase, Mutator family
MVLTPGDRGLDREQGVPRASGQVQAERLDLGKHALQCRPVRSRRPVTAGAASAAGSAVVRGDHVGLPARHLHPQGRRPGQGARRRQRDRQVGGELDLRRARSKWRRSGTAAWPSSRFGTCSWTRAAPASGGQGWPQAARQGSALTPARTPPHCCKPRIRSRSRRGLTVGVCRVHFLRNVLTQVPKGHANRVAAAIRTIFAQPDVATGARTSCPALPRPGGSPRSGDDQSPAWWQT